MNDRRWWISVSWIVSLIAVLAVSPRASTADKPVALPRTDLYGDPLPAGAIARLGTVRFRHKGDGLPGLAFLADSKTLISATFEDHAIQLWEASSGRLLREISTGTVSIRCFALSPNGKCAVVGGFLPFGPNQRPRGSVRVLDVSSGKEVRTFQRDADETDYGSLAFTPDNKFLMSYGGRSGVLRIEDIASGTEVLQRKFPQDYGQMALSPDGSTVAVGSGPNTQKLFVWRWQKQEEPLELKAPRFRSLTFSADNKWLATCSDVDGTIRVWEVARVRLVHHLVPPETDSFSLSDVVYSPDGKTLAISGYRGSWVGTIHLWDAATGRYRGRLETGYSAGRLAISADSRLLAAATANALRVWELASRRDLAPNDDAHQGWVSQVAVTRAGLVATASDDHTVRVWDAATGKQRLKLTHGSWVRAIAISPDGTKLASSSLDDTVRLWDLGTGQEIYQLAGHGGLGGHRTLGFTADGKRFLSWGDDFYLRVWDVATGKAVHEHRIRPTGITVPDEEDEVFQREKFFLSSAAAFSPDGTQFILGGIGQNAHIFDAQTGKELRIINTEVRGFQSLEVSPDGNQLLVGGWGNPVVGLCNLKTGKRAREFTLPDKSSWAVALSPDGRMVAAGLEGSICLVETATGGERARLSGFRGKVRALAFSPDGQHLVSMMYDTTGLVWDLRRR